MITRQPGGSPLWQEQKEDGTGDSRWRLERSGLGSRHPIAEHELRNAQREEHLGNVEAKVSKAAREEDGR